MEPNYSKIFNKKTIKSLTEYCELNNIETLNEGEKDLKTDVVEEKQLIKEVIVEKRVEIPVEVIKEIVVEKEVIKEVPVEKIVTVYDRSGENELGEKITKLKEEMSKKDKELDELRRNLDIKLDDTNEKMLQETLQKLRKELIEKNEKIKDLEKINQGLLDPKQKALNAVFLRGSNLNNTI